MRNSLSFLSPSRSTLLFILSLFILPMPGREGILAAQEAQNPLGIERLLAELRAGGLIIFFRHAKTDRDQVDQELGDFTDCSKQRNLSQEGRYQARDIGKAIRSMNIPIGKVLSSPFCRCKETAQLAFGEFETSRDLRFGMGVDFVETAALAMTLREMLAIPPVPGTNTILVSHTANLKEATGIWPNPEGAAYIFKPFPGVGFKYLGNIPPDGW